MEHDRQSGLEIKPIGVERASPSDPRNDWSAAPSLPPAAVVPRHRKNVLPVLFGTVVCGLALAYLYSIVPKYGGILYYSWVSPEPRESRASVQKARVASLPPQEPADIPADFINELTAPSSISHVDFSRSFTRPIDKVCGDLASLTRGKFKAEHNPVAEGQWVCSSDILPAGDASTSPNVSSVFVWMRGAEHREIDLLRLKLNLTDSASSEAAKALALDLLGKLHSSLGWDIPRGLEVAVREVKDVSFDQYGISYKTIREWSSVPRLNVIIRAHDRSGIIPVNAFALGSAPDALHTQAIRNPAGLLKPSLASQEKRNTKAWSEAEPIENLLE